MPITELLQADNSKKIGYNTSIVKNIRQPLVKLVLFYFRILARLQLKKINPIIIGVGGASGKTSLSGLIFLILKEKYKVRQGMGKNSETGLPLNILGISINNYSTFDWIKAIILAPLKVILDWNNYDIYVAEMGIDGPFEPKNMSYLLKILKLQIGVLTNISLEHSQYFDSLVKDKNPKEREKEILDLIATQESLLVTTLSKQQTAVINADDSQTQKYLDKIKANVVSVSLSDPKADFFVRNIETSINSFKVNFYNNKKNYDIKLNIPLPSHYAYSFLLAIAVCSKLGFSIEEAIKALEKNFLLPPGRLSVFEGIKETLIIDSSYNNATLTPLLDILEMLKEIAGKRRKVAILGDMRELGTVSQAQHEIIAKKILETCDLAILIGPEMEKFVAPILKNNNFTFSAFPTFTNAKEEILKIIKSQDLVLIKSSQNTLFLERVVEMLLKNAIDKEKLCRRGEFWDKKRQQSL